MPSNREIDKLALDLAEHIRKAKLAPAAPRLRSMRYEAIKVLRDAKGSEVTKALVEMCEEVLGTPPTAYLDAPESGKKNEGRERAIIVEALYQHLGKKPKPGEKFVLSKALHQRIAGVLSDTTVRKWWDDTLFSKDVAYVVAKLHEQFQRAAQAEATARLFGEVDAETGYALTVAETRRAAGVPRSIGSTIVRLWRGWPEYEKAVEEHAQRWANGVEEVRAEAAAGIFDPDALEGSDLERSDAEDIETMRAEAEAGIFDPDADPD